MKIREYTVNDRSRLVELFAQTLVNQPSYISHGEIQMGLSYDGQNIAPDFETKWGKYLDRQFSNPDEFVYLYEDDGAVIGFIIFGIESDYDKKYGVIHDILLAHGYKGTGAGSKLFQFAYDYFVKANIMDCYMESGVNNHGAHAFFEKKGFKHISNIYRLDNIGR